MRRSRSSRRRTTRSAVPVGRPTGVARVTGALCISGVALLMVGCGGDAEESADSTTTTAVVVATLAPPSTPAPSTTVDTSPGAVLTAPIEYTIVDGDSPSLIASRYSIPLQALLDENGWELVDQQVPAFPFAGAVIRIPAGATVPVETVPSTPASGSGDTASETTEPESGACGTYVIMEGDSPSVVATKLDTTVDKLNAVNADTAGYAGFILGITIQVPC